MWTTRAAPAAAAPSMTFAVPPTLTRTKSAIDPHSCTKAAVWTTRSVPSSASRIASGSATSAWTNAAPAAPIRAAAGSTSSPRTSAPSATRRRQIVSPMNPPAPVTAALRPSKRP